MSAATIWNEITACKALFCQKKNNKMLLTIYDILGWMVMVTQQRKSDRAGFDPVYLFHVFGWMARDQAV